MCGVEDTQLYGAGSPFRGLWRDAWDAARLRLPESQIVLVINPPTIRSQIHLHIHIVRGSGTAFPANAGLALASLDDVWNEARRFARDRLAIADANYGIAVRRRDGGFEMLVEAGAPANLRNPESKYSVEED